MELLNLIKCELKLDLKRLMSYRVSLISDIVIFATVIITTFLAGLDYYYASTFDLDLLSGKMLVLIGFIFWQISSTALGWSSYSVRNETASGTFELKMQSKFPVELMLFIEMLTYVFFSFVSLAIIFMASVLFFGGDFSEVLYILLSYVVALPAVIGMFGIGLILGGISLREKQIGNLVFILQTALVFVSDFVGVKSRAFNAIPFNAGIKIVRNIYLNQEVGFSLVLDYFFVNVLWLIIGVLIFKFFLARERKNGAFDSY